MGRGIHERKAQRQKTMPVTTSAPMSAQISFLSHPPLSTKKVASNAANHSTDFSRDL